MTNINPPIKASSPGAATERGPQPLSPPDADGWTIVSKPGAAVEISTRPLPDYIREAIARNLGIGTGQPHES